MAGGCSSLQVPLTYKYEYDIVGMFGGLKLARVGTCNKQLVAQTALLLLSFSCQVDGSSIFAHHLQTASCSRHARSPFISLVPQAGPSRNDVADGLELSPSGMSKRGQEGGRKKDKTIRRRA